MKKNRKYTEQFKKDAIRYIVLEGESVASVAERLGVNANLLYGWKKVYLDKCGGETREKDEPNLKDVVAENERLRKELRRAERATEILKKTVGFFAKDEI